YNVLSGSVDDIDHAPAALVEFLKREERRKIEYDGGHMDISDSVIRDMLNHIENNNCEYDEWLKIGMAVHDATQGSGIDIWREWSKRSSKHNDETLDFKF